MWPFNKPAKKSLSAFQAAVKAGKLIDMQKKPYKKFNEFLQYTSPTGMTPAAFNEFINIPREKGHKHIQKAARWAMLLMEAHKYFDTWHDDPGKDDTFDTMFDIEVARLSGFHRFKKIRIRIEHSATDDDNFSAIVFMLPDEDYPLPS